MAKCKRFLMSYLSEVNSTEVANGHKEDIDTALLLEAVAENNHDSLLDLLVTENFCLLPDSARLAEAQSECLPIPSLDAPKGSPPSPAPRPHLRMLLCY